MAKAQAKKKEPAVQYMGYEDFGSPEKGSPNMGRQYAYLTEEQRHEVNGLCVYKLDEDCPHAQEEAVYTDDRDHPEEVRHFCQFVGPLDPGKTARPNHYVCPHYHECYPKKK